MEAAGWILFICLMVADLALWLQVEQVEIEDYSGTGPARVFAGLSLFSHGLLVAPLAFLAIRRYQRPREPSLPVLLTERDTWALLEILDHAGSPDGLAAILPSDANEELVSTAQNEFEHLYGKVWAAHKALLRPPGTLPSIKFQEDLVSRVRRARGNAAKRLAESADFRDAMTEVGRESDERGTEH